MQVAKLSLRHGTTPLQNVYCLHCHINSIVETKIFNDMNVIILILFFRLKHPKSNWTKYLKTIKRFCISSWSHSENIVNIGRKKKHAERANEKVLNKLYVVHSFIHQRHFHVLKNSEKKCCSHTWALPFRRWSIRIFKEATLGNFV